MAENHVEVSSNEAIATIVLKRPDRLNAFTPQMQRQLVEALGATDADDSVPVVIVTGSGRAFCAGLRPLWERKQPKRPLAGASERGA